MTKQLTLNFTDYVIKGESTIKLWGGGIGNIRMNTIHTDNIDNITLDMLNDGGFGCQEILGGYLIIYENYEGYLKCIDQVVIGDYYEPDEEVA